ncbi:lipid II:glycine glycyltransferase FemX [Buchananella felis]|uniref:lipid II:glycine glycyltransferase FemX n=1 Tax=Buchananella felis TaxID=3231492 RepID=UPI00352703EB
MQAADSAMTVTELTAQEFKVALAGVRPIPVDQSAAWEALDARLEGRQPWKRLRVDEDGKPVAFVYLAEYKLRGAAYLWARSGPIYVKEQSPAREEAIRAALVAYVRAHHKKAVFLRLHARYRGPDTLRPLQIITYDRTVKIPLAPRSEEEILATMTTDGKRSIRRALKRIDEGGAEFCEDTGLSREAFGEYYAVLRETARRDGFSPHPESYYWAMLEGMGQDVARLFGVRREGKLLCWDLVLVHDKQAVAFFGASLTEAREVLGPDALDWHVARTLAAEGVESFDLMGIDSPTTPELYGVGRYKRKFALAPTDVDAAWDVPVRPVLYRALAGALRMKRALRG